MDTPTGSATVATRRGDWIQTYTGIAFYPLDPRVEEVDTEDIAHALAHLCRYGGHTDKFYSVAEHCVIMSLIVPHQHALWALLHDAAEAYMVDLPRPIKRVMPEYSRYEDRIMEVIASKYSLRGAMPESVKKADSRILLDERAALMKPPPDRWRQDEIGLAPLGVPIRAWSPEQAKAAYLHRLNFLLANPSVHVRRSRVVR